MPEGTARQMRDKAVFALLSLTGIRVAALVSLRIKHIDLEEKSADQNPREVATKFGKLIDTFFVKGFSDAEPALSRWSTHLDEVTPYGPYDPLFPATALKAKSSAAFQVEGFTRSLWKTTEPVRQIVSTAFADANLPIHSPHTFRHMLARHIFKTCATPAELVAASQNLGHSDVLTTLRSYGQIGRDRERELVTVEMRKEGQCK